MKVETKQVVIQKTVYVASDGEEFDSMKTCTEHEQYIEKEKCLEMAEKLPHFNFSPPTPVDSEYIWTYCNNRQELEAVMLKYQYEEDIENLYGSELDTIPLPGWVLTASHHGYGYIESADSELEDFQKFVNDVRELMENGG